MAYVEVSWFPSRLEAEAVGHALDQYDIPFVVQSSDTGMFGPGMTGWSPQGAKLLVPEERFDEVRELLSCVVKPLADGDAEADKGGETEGDEAAEAAADEAGDPEAGGTAPE